MEQKKEINNSIFEGNHKKHLSIFIVILLFIFYFPFFSAGSAGNAAGSGTDIEIPVRVFYNGNLVNNLSKEDFKIYEDNRLQTIKDFSIKRKDIKSQSNSRYFVLIFKIIEYNEQVRESLATIFNDILEEGDRLMILFGNKTIFYRNVTDKDKTYSTIEKMIRKQCELMAKSMKTDIKKTEEFIGKLRSDYERNVSNKMSYENQGRIYQHYYMVYFRSYLRRYLDILLDYNKRYLLPDLDKYVLLSKDIKKIEREKWIIHLYQMAKVPQLSRRNRAMIKKMINDLANSESANPDDEYDYEKKISRLLGSIDDALSVTFAYPEEEISKLFYNIKATFSTIFLDTGKKFKEYKEFKVKNPRHQSVSQRIENHLMNIVKRTGGSFIDLRVPEEKLDTFIETEDVYYLLTYSPKDAGKAGKIKVELSNENYEVQYDDNIKADFINELIEKKGGGVKKIQVKDITYKQKKLSLKIAHFLMKESQDQKVGNIHVHIRIEDKNNKTIFDENKALISKKDMVTISIGLNLRKNEKYDVMAKVTDLISGETYIEYCRIPPNSPPDFQ